MSAATGAVTRRAAWAAAAAVPVVSILLALFVGGIVIAVSGLATKTGLSLTLPIAAYESLFEARPGSTCSM